MSDKLPRPVGTGVTVSVLKASKNHSSSWKQFVPLKLRRRGTKQNLIQFLPHRERSVLS